MSRVEIFTDGACRGNPGPGGWGVLLRYGEHERRLSGGERETTNNRMELTAAIKALEALNRPCDVDLYTDSEYLRRGITDWLAQWKQRDWRTASKKPVSNQDLWRALDEQVERHRVRFHWVKGHSGNTGNEIADQLANHGIDSLAEHEK